MESRQSTSCEALLPSTSTRDYLHQPSPMVNARQAKGQRSHRTAAGGSYHRLDMDQYLSSPYLHPARNSWNRDETTSHWHRRELTMMEKYDFDLSKARLKASSRTSALLAGFAMICLVELQYNADTPHWLLIVLGVVTALLVSVHLLALMMSTCILPYIEAAEAVNDTPHIRLKFYIDLSWFFSTCIGLILFLLEIGIIFYVKFQAVGFERAGWITSAILVPVLFVFVIISCFIHRSRAIHTIDRIDKKVNGLRQMLYDSEHNVALLKTV